LFLTFTKPEKCFAFNAVDILALCFAFDEVYILASVIILI